MFRMIAVIGFIVMGWAGAALADQAVASVPAGVAPSVPTGPKFFPLHSARIVQARKMATSSGPFYALRQPNGHIIHGSIPEARAAKPLKSPVLSAAPAGQPVASGAVPNITSIIPSSVSGVAASAAPSVAANVVPGMTSDKARQILSLFPASN